MSDVIITPNRGVATEGKIEFYSGATPALSGTISINSGNITIVPEGAGTVQVGKAGNTTTIPGDLTITGNLTINGTTTTVNSTTITVDDPIFTIGGDTAPTSDDNKDRGVAFRWHNGTAARLGFFGFDDSTGKFTFIPEATDTSDVFSGTTGEIDAKLDWANVLNKPTIGTGTVTSVGMTVPTGLSVSPASITTSGTFAVTYAAGYSIPTTTSQTNWDTAYSERLRWDGGSSGLTASTGRTSLGASTVGSNLFTLTNPSAISFLRVNADNTVTAQTAANFRTDIGATTVGSNLFTLTNPSAITFLRVNADNTVTARSAADFRADIGAGTGNGTVTSVGFTGGIISVGTATTTPAFTVAGTSGGIPYFSSGSTWASSNALAANALVIGGGAGAAPSTTTTAAGILTFLGTPSSDNLRSAITDETGTGGGLVFATEPTLTRARISTASVSAAGTTQVGATGLTADMNLVTTANASTDVGVRLPTAVAGMTIRVRNLTGISIRVYPASGGKIGTLATDNYLTLGDKLEGVFVASSSTQWHSQDTLLDNTTITNATLKDPSISITGSTGSLDFATTNLSTKRTYVWPDVDGTIVVDTASRKTGSGTTVVYQTSPSLVTPTLGVATATSINGLTVSNSTGTLTIANSKTLTCNNTLTFSGTDASTVAFGAGGTVLYNGGALGTPSSGTLTNCSGLPISGIASLGSNVGTFLATPSSANLAAAITDETGSGALVFGTSPTLTTPALSGETFSTTNNVTAGTNSQGQGALTSDYNVITTATATPSGVTLPTATTGRRIVVVNKGANTVFVYPATGGYIDGLAINAGIQLLSGSVMVFNASSTTQWYSSANMEFASPFLGTASATSINKLAITAPATSATLTIANGKTFTCNNTLTFSGTDSSSVAFGAGGTVAYTGNKLNVFAATTSAELAGVISDETGSGSLVFATSPTLVTPLLGTPTSGNLSNCTNIPVNQATGTLAVANGGTGITSFGTGVATWLGTPSSANLAAAITDETGSGALVFGTSPTFTTSLVAGSTTMALLDTTATTINFGRAATNITLGATNGTVTCQYNLVVSNKLEATTKSFVIDHPTKWKEGMKLRYACLEGPENGVYVRGSLTDEDTIELPEYWMNLVDENSITVNLTPIGSSNGHYVKSIKNNVVTVGSRSGNINCHYIVYGERKDVSKLVVEYHAA